MSVTGGVSRWVTKFNADTHKSDDKFLEQFVGPADARFVEIAPSSSGGEFRYTSKRLLSTLNEKESFNIFEFTQLPHKGLPAGCLRLVVLPLNTDDDTSAPFSWGQVESHLELLHLQNSYIYDDRLQAPPGWFEIPLSGEFKGFVIKPEKWDSNLTNFSLSVAYSPARRVTTVIAHMLRKADIDHLLARLKKLKSIAWHPLLVPLILLETRIESIASDLGLVRESLYSTEKVMGTHKNYHGKRHHKRANFYAYGSKVWEQGDEFKSAPGKLTSIVSDCAMFEAKCLINESLLSWLQGLNTSLCEGRDANPVLSALSSGSIRMKISAMDIWLSNNRTRSNYLAKRAESQMQASLNLMAQFDNALNLRTASATVRDSSDMRAIAWVTLAFLPATFVATFFSTSFFSFEQNGHRVSDWIWLYCVVSILLTTSVLGGWAWWVRREDRNPPSGVEA